MNLRYVVVTSVTRDDLEDLAQRVKAVEAALQQSDSLIEQALESDKGKGESVSPAEEGDQE